MGSNCGHSKPEGSCRKAREPFKKGHKKQSSCWGTRTVNFRRSDFDVSNRINTTDPVCVKLEVARIHRSLYQVDSPALQRAFDDLVSLYFGHYPGYSRCDTAYHDLQHVMDVTLAMARLIDGYDRT